MKIEQKIINLNYRYGRTKPIAAIVIHHTAGIITADALYRWFNTPGKNVSAHYGIGSDGVVAQFVPENSTAWHVGKSRNSKIDNTNTIGIEVSNSSLAPKWEVGDKSIDLLVELLYDIAKRNKLFPLIYGVNIFGHRDLAATLCPGDYLYAKIAMIISKVNKM